MSRSYFGRTARIYGVVASCAFCLVLMGASRGSITKLTLNPDAPVVDLFDGIEQEQFDVRLVAMNANDGKIFITNKTDKPLTVSIPKGLAGVQVFPQINQFGNPFGNQFGNQGAGINNGQNGQGQNGLAQAVGGNANPIGQNAFPGGGIGQQPGGGLNPGFFSIPPEKTVQIGLSSVCLNYGRRQPHAGMKYQLVKADAVTTDPLLVQLLEDYTPRTNRDSQQAAAWHLSSGLTWEQIAKLTDEKVPGNPVPLFTRQQIQGAKTLVDNARKRAAERPRKNTDSASSVAAQ